MGYNCPSRQEQIYSIQAEIALGYICPMTLTFKESLSAQRDPRSMSMERVAAGAGVSVHILKNANQAHRCQGDSSTGAGRRKDFWS